MTKRARAVMEKMAYWDAKASLAQVLMPDLVNKIRASGESPYMWPVTSENILKKLQIPWSNSGGNAHHSSKWEELHKAIMRLPT